MICYCASAIRENYFGRDLDELRKLARLSRRKSITLVYGAADETHHQAVALP